MGVIENIEFDLDRDKLIAQLGVDTDDEEDLGIINYLINKSQEVGNPKILYKECVVEDISDGIVMIDGIEFVSSALSRNMAGVEKCYPYITTCGVEIDLIELPDDSAIIEYWRDEIKNKLLMRARKHFNTVLKEEFNIENSASMAPGSADVDVWLVDEQKKLFSLFEEYGREIGVVLNDSCLMTPNKSLSGIAFKSDTDFVSCLLCQREGCMDRKIGFDESLYQIMHQ